MPRDLDTASDPDLIAAAAAGDPRAFAAFYDRHEAPLLGFLVRATRDAEVAADLAGEVFATLLREVARGTTIQEPRGWLYAVARRKIVDGVRRGRVDASTRQALRLQPVVLTDAALERIDELGDDTAERAREALAALPAEQREAVAARVIDELPYDAIAGQMGCSEAVVRKRVSRGLARLRQRLQEQPS